MSTPRNSGLIMCTIQIHSTKWLLHRGASSMLRICIMFCQLHFNCFSAIPAIWQKLDRQCSKEWSPVIRMRFGKLWYMYVPKSFYSTLLFQVNARMAIPLEFLEASPSQGFVDIYSSSISSLTVHIITRHNCCITGQNACTRSVLWSHATIHSFGVLLRPAIYMVHVA